MAALARRPLLPAALLAAVATTSRGFSEPDELKYFGVAGGAKPFQALRVANITSQEFERLARTGVPFVITDGSRGWPMEEWNCDYLQKNFAGVRFRQEYGNSELNNLGFENKDWTKSKVKIQRKLPKGAPQYKPFYSDLVKARRGEPERKWGKKKAADAMEAAIISSTRTTYCMSESNLQEMQKNPEFWLQPPETGSMAHMDEHCVPTIATTLSGVKRWRLQHIPANPHPEGYFDGLIYDRGEWDPLFEFETRPGESVIFPPGMVHEGKSVGDDCVSSITYQYMDPAPTGYWRSYFPRIRRTKDMRACFPFIRMMATFGDMRYQVKALEAAKKDGRQLAEKLDKDGDGKISLEEVQQHIGKRNFEHHWTKNLPADALNYHDSNVDGEVTLAEVEENFAAWSEVEHAAEKEGLVFRDDEEL